MGTALGSSHAADALVQAMQAAAAQPHVAHAGKLLLHLPAADGMDVDGEEGGSGAGPSSAQKQRKGGWTLRRASHSHVCTPLHRRPGSLRSILCQLHSRCLTHGAV